MAAQSTNPARGMRDFLPADVRKREYVIGVIKEVYESYGFEPLETPAVENLETLTGKYGEEGSQPIFKILKRGEKLAQDWINFQEQGRFPDLYSRSSNPLNELADLALRYDLTVPLARVVANHKNDLPKFFKRYQIQPVWRADRPARGRFREFYQCDVDTIGSKSMLVEAEQISAVCEILERLGFEDYIVRINHRKILEGMLAVANVPNHQEAESLITIDKRDKIGRPGIEQEFDMKKILEDKGVRGILLEVLLSSFDIIGKLASEHFEQNHLPDSTVSLMSNEAFEKIKSYIGQNSKGVAGLNAVENMLKLFSKRVGFDPSLARGLSYYTGAVFEVVLTRGDFQGSLAGGGRYDNLIGMFGKEEIPACGFSLGLERILVVMEERGMFPEDLQNSSAADVMVTIWNEESIGESLKLASEIRANGLRVLVYPEADKLGKQFKYASQINVPFVCVLGASELAENNVTLKNMLTGEQETLLREKIAVKIIAAAKARGQ